jgi:hypothetical protein
MKYKWQYFREEATIYLKLLPLLIVIMIYLVWRAMVIRNFFRGLPGPR